MHSLTATATSPVGKTSPHSASMDFIVDTAKVAVSIDSVYDDVGSIVGFVALDGVTDDALPKVSGKATRGGTVTLYDGIGTVVGTAVADSHTGEWTIQIKTPNELAEGAHTLRATVTPVGGMESAAQDFRLLIDRTAPGVPEIQSVYDNVGFTTGYLSQNAHTDDTTPTVSGKADPGSIVVVFDNGKEVGRVLASALGQWSLTVDAPPVNPGTHQFTAVAVDAAGNARQPSPGWTVVVDSSGPNLPDGTTDPLSLKNIAVTSITRDTGVSDTDFITSDTTLVFRGTTNAADGSRVDVRLDGVHLDYVLVANGAWVYDHTRVSLSPGDHHVRADLVDLADNVAKSSLTQTVVVDTSGSLLPNGTPDPLATKAIAVTAITLDSGVSNTDFITNDPTLVFTGTSTAADGSDVALRLNGIFVGYTKVMGGVWRYDNTAASSLAIGNYDVRADLVDTAGNIAVSSVPRPMVIDTMGDRLPSGQHDTLADQTIAVTVITVDSGFSNTDFITNDPTLVIGGTSSAPDGSHVAVWVNGELLAYREVRNGTWSFDYTAKALDAGYYAVRADLVDVAGNIASSSPVRTIVMDRSGSEFADGRHDPLADQAIAVTAIVVDNGVKPDDFITRDTNLLFTGVTNAANGSHVAVSLNGVFLGYVEVSGGAWTYDHSSVTLSDGNYTLRADLVDAAGNIAVSSFVKQFSIDNSGSLLPDGTRDPLVDGVITITSIETDTGVSNSDFITNATSITAHGDGVANAWLRVFLDGKYLGFTQVDGSGHWSYGMSTPQGGHTISADYIDPAENVVPGPSASHALTVDTTAPTLSIAGPGGTATGPVTYYFNFNEAVTGFDASDVSLSHASLSNFTKISDTQYSATVTPVGSGTGTMTLAVGSNSYADVAGNGGDAGNASQPYMLGPPDVLDLGSWGQGIKPWQVAGTNKVFYYLDVNKDGLTDPWYPYSPDNWGGDDRINTVDIHRLFPGMGAGATSAIVNGHKITLPDAVSEGIWLDDLPAPYTTQMTFDGIVETYNYYNPDSLLAMKYAVEKIAPITPLSNYPHDIAPDNPPFNKGDFWTSRDGTSMPDTEYDSHWTLGYVKTYPFGGDEWPQIRGSGILMPMPAGKDNYTVIFMYEMPVI